MSNAKAKRSSKTMAQQREALYKALEDLHEHVLRLKKHLHIKPYPERGVSGLRTHTQLEKLVQNIVTSTQALDPYVRQFNEIMQDQFHPTLTTTPMARFYELNQQLLEDLLQCMCQAPKAIKKTLMGSHHFLTALEKEVLWLNAELADEQNKPRWSMF